MTTAAKQPAAPQEAILPMQPEQQAQTAQPQEAPQQMAVTQPTPPPAFPAQLRGLEMCFSQPRKAFLAAGGTEQQFAKEVNFAMQAMINNQYLIACAKQYPEHLIEAIKNVSLTGLTLNPVLRLGYLVPYKGKIQFQPSYMGKIDILYRTGVVKRIEANLVYENDKFSMTRGIGGTLKHEPKVFGDRGKLLGGYFIATLTTGETICDAMPIERIEVIKNRSESVKSGKQSPWNTDYEEMCRKTILNWAIKFLPKTGISDDMVKVLEVEGKQEIEMFDDWRRSQMPNYRDPFDEDEYVEAEVVE